MGTEPRRVKLGVVRLRFSSRAIVFLRLNGRRLVAPGPELYAIVMAAATGAIGVEKVAEWLKTKVELRAALPDES